MKVRLVISNILRWRLRSTFTFLTVLVAFLLLGLMLPLERVFNLGVELANADRLIMVNKASVLSALPVKYLERIKDNEDVEQVGHFTFFGGYYRDTDNTVSTIVTDPRFYEDVIEEVYFSNQQHKQDWFADRSSVAIGRDLATKYDWKVGDLLPIYSSFYPRSNGSRSWTFRVAAIFEPKESEGSTATIVVHYSHFDELRVTKKGLIDWFTIRMVDADNISRTIEELDTKFKNSPHETKTSTEESFIQDFMNQIGDFTAIITLSLSAVFFTLLLVSGNTMAQSVNERISELAVLKTLGFTNRSIFFLIVSESLLLTLAGGIAGMAISYFVIPVVVDLSGNLLSGMIFLRKDIAVGIACMLVVAIIASVGPALKAMRMSIVDGLETTS